MKKILVVMLALVMVVALLLTACSGGTKSGDTKEGDTKEGDTTSSNADEELMVGIGKVNSNFNTYAAYGDDTYGMMQVYDTLTIKNAKGEVVPSVASWEVSEDGTVYTFTIRDDVKFSNGKAFTTDDAVFNLEQAIASSYINWTMVGVEAVEKVDDKQFTVTLAAPDVIFLEKLTWVYLVNKEAYEAAGDQYGLTVENIVGSGPYTLSEWIPGEKAVFVANEDYWQGAPSIKKATFQTMSDDNAAVISLQTGEIGLLIKDVPSVSLPTLEGDKNITVTSFSSYVFMDVLMNAGDGIFADKTVRQAVAYGVDRDKMLTVGTEGLGYKVDYPAGPDYIANPQLEDFFYEYDPAKAAQMITDAGLAGQTVTIRTMDTPPWPKLATALQDDLNKMGFNAKVEQLDYTAYSEQVWGNADFEIAIGRFWSGTKDTGEVLSMMLSTAPGTLANFGNYENPDIEPFLAEGSSTTDLERRKEVYTEAIKIFREDVPLIPLYYTNGSRAYTSKLTIDENLVQYDRLFYYSWK